MAIDLCSESSGLLMSPRISFSHDLCQTDAVPIEQNKSRLDLLLLDSSSDFDFCVSDGFEQESSSADELFSNGKILPIQIRQKSASSKPPPAPLNPTPKVNSKKESLKEIMAMQSETEEKQQQQSKSLFWRFKRSSSCGNGYKRSLICSLPLLSRSYSTGSAATSPKRPPLLKDTSHKHSQKSSSIATAKSSSSSSFSSYCSSQRPPLKKNYGHYGNGVRISPVLNVPPPYIAKGTANLFGLGSFFCNGKDKNKKR